MYLLDGSLSPLSGPRSASSFPFAVPIIALMGDHQRPFSPPAPVRAPPHVDGERTSEREIVVAVVAATDAAAAAVGWRSSARICSWQVGAFLSQGQLLYRACVRVPPTTTPLLLCVQCTYPTMCVCVDGALLIYTLLHSMAEAGFLRSDFFFFRLN